LALQLAQADGGERVVQAAEHLEPDALAVPARVQVDAARWNDRDHPLPAAVDGARRQAATVARADALEQPGVSLECPCARPRDLDLRVGMGEQEVDVAALERGVPGAHHLYEIR